MAGMSEGFRKQVAVIKLLCDVLNSPSEQEFFSHFKSRKVPASLISIGLSVTQLHQRLAESHVLDSEWVMDVAIRPIREECEYDHWLLQREICALILASPSLPSRVPSSAQDHLWSARGIPSAKTISDEHITGLAWATLTYDEYRCVMPSIGVLNDEHVGGMPSAKNLLDEWKNGLPASRRLDNEYVGENFSPRYDTSYQNPVAGLSEPVEDSRTRSAIVNTVAKSKTEEIIARVVTTWLATRALSLEYMSLTRPEEEAEILGRTLAYVSDRRFQELQEVAVGLNLANALVFMNLDEQHPREPLKEAADSEHLDASFSGYSAAKYELTLTEHVDSILLLMAKLFKMMSPSGVFYLLTTSKSEADLISQHFYARESWPLEPSFFHSNREWDVEEVGKTHISGTDDTIYMLKVWSIRPYLVSTPDPRLPLPASKTTEIKAWTTRTVTYRPAQNPGVA